MNISFRKRTGPLAVLVALSGLGCLMLADTAAAAAPTEGVSCAPTDGKIDGRGSTYQTHAQSDWANAFREEFCGPVAEQYAGDPAGNTMVAYNYPKAAEASQTGSGAGLKAASCRTDSFAGSDVPYSESQLLELNSTPGKMGGCTLTFEPPFTPKSGFPGPEDKEAKVMSFPIAGSSVAMAVNLSASECGGTAPTALSFTGKELSRIFGGDATKWNDAELVANNKSLEKCEVPIVRVVRQDNSGTTNIFKQYLIRVDNARTGATCAPGHEWAPYNNAPNTTWPNSGEGGTCTEVIHAAKSGGPELVALLKSTHGGVGYADLADTVGQGLLLATVRNATNTSYQAPSSGKAANCTYSVLSLPGSSPSDAVGLNTEDNWSNNNETNPGNPANHENATDLGSRYPICGLTFDLVYAGIDNGKVANADARLTADQRRTLYAYFTFILSSLGQDILGGDSYAPLPSSWLPTLREGFQANF